MYEIEKLSEIKKSLCDVDITSESIIEDLNNKVSEYENVLQSLKTNRGMDTNELHVKIEKLKEYYKTAYKHNDKTITSVDLKADLKNKINELINFLS
jgi:hypothetical protein